MFKWVSVLSTCKLSAEKDACWKSAELSDRPTSLVCRAPAIALNWERTHLCTPPRQTNSEFTVFRGDRDLYSRPSTRGVRLPSEKIPSCQPTSDESTHHLLSWQDEGGALKLVRGDAAFLIMSLYLPPSPSNLREKQLSEKNWKWARKILDETPSRVVPVLLLDANGHISHTPWADQVGKYSSIKTTFNGQCLEELLRDHHLQAANTYFPVGATFFGPFSNTQIDFTCLPSSFRVHRCCALHHDGDRLQLAAAPGRRDHRPIQCVFQHQLTYGMHEKARASMGQDQTYAGCSFCVGADPLSVTSGGSLKARRRVEPSGSYRFMGETQSGACDGGI